MALESEEDKCMYAFGAALATQTDQFKKVRCAWNTPVRSVPQKLSVTPRGQLKIEWNEHGLAAVGQDM